MLHMRVGCVALCDAFVTRSDTQTQLTVRVYVFGSGTVEEKVQKALRERGVKM